MSRSAVALSSALVIVALALPATAFAQRARSGGSDGSGSGGGRTSSEPSGTAQPRSAPSAPSAPSGGSTSSGSNSAPSQASGGRSSSTDNRALRPGASGNRPINPRSTGTAQPRPAYQRPYQGGSTVYSYTYPYFGVGLYNPWYYGASSWGWNRWGYGYNYGHDPFLYDPFGYYSVYPYYWGNLSDRESWASEEEQDRQPSGSLRLRVSPREAKVYVDGALAGVVDEFDGLTNHLRLPAGPHQIEFRADGYETLTMDVTVQDGKTRTERASLKRR